MEKPTDDSVRKIAQILCEKNWKLCVAESVTVGQLQSSIGRIPGASNYFAGGITTYNLAQKVHLLGVDKAAAEKCNCVSAAVAEQMATGVGKMFNADIAIATTGYAEPSPDEEVEHPFAFVALWQASDPQETGKTAPKVTSQKVEGPPFDQWLTTVDRRQSAQQHFAEFALKALWETLQATSPASSG